VRTVKRALVIALAACGDPAPCDDIAATCAELVIESPELSEVDSVELDVLYRGFHGTTTTMPEGGGTVGLPLVTAIELADPGAEPFKLGVVAAGKLSGNVLGTGAATLTVAPGAHVTLTLVLVAPELCEPGGRYCGGDMLAGDPQTVYTCNGGGVPIARGTCLDACVNTPNVDDECNAAGGPCTLGGDYCGGDELAGDPQTLYTCGNAGPTNPRPCPNRCVVRPSPMDDICE
jgi:hypothetical protein